MEKAFGDVPADLKARLLSVAVPTISAVLFKKGFNSRFFAGLQPLSENAGRFCGPAWPVRAVPVREDLRAKIASGELPSPNRQAFDATPAGAVLVCGSGLNPDSAVMGDIIAGAPNGAVCIPRDIAEAVADAAVEQEALEAFILARVQAGAALEGTYPPNVETLAAYRTWRAPRKPQSEPSRPFPWRARRVSLAFKDE